MAYRRALRSSWRPPRARGRRRRQHRRHRDREARSSRRGYACHLPSRSNHRSARPTVCRFRTRRLRRRRRVETSPAYKGLELRDAGLRCANPTKTETLNVVSAPNVGMSPEQVSSILFQQLRARRPSLVLSVNRAATLCGGLPGWTMVYLNASGSTEIRHIIGVTPTRQYIATYQRLTNTKGSAEASAALQSFCPRASDFSTANSFGKPPLEAPARWTAGTTAAFASSAASPPMWLWFGPISKGSTQLVMATSITTPTSQGTDDQVFAAIRKLVEARFGPLQIADRHQVTLCSVTQGTFFRMIGTQNTMPIAIDLVISTGVPTSYVAMYMHQTAVPAPADRQSAG